MMNEQADRELAPATELVVRAEDGYALSATLYAGNESNQRVVVAGATGVPQGFYRRFAAFIASRGYSAVTFDYRGIGRSRSRPLQGFEASFLDWARLDLEAVVRDSLARGPTAVVGHSCGGHAFGLLPSANDTLGLYAFGMGTGWHGYMPALEQLKVLFMWNVVAPIVTRLHGYLPSSRLGLGEDLPLGVYTQWRRWCRFQHYFFDDPAFTFTESFSSVRTPIVAVNASDDRWAPPASRDAFLTGYRNAPVTRVDLNARHTAIGHMGYFRPHQQEPLWEEVAAFLRDRAPGAP